MTSQVGTRGVQGWVKTPAEGLVHQGKEDGSSFINHNELSLAQFHSICRMYVLQEGKMYIVSLAADTMAAVAGESP